MPRRRDGFWFVFPGGHRPNWIVNLWRNEVVIEMYERDGGVKVMSMNRREARMLAKRINQALDATLIRPKKVPR
jgi:hypothetical protein